MVTKRRKIHFSFKRFSNDRWREIDNWEKPSKNLPVEKFIVTEKNPKIVHVPAGYANGFKTLVQDTKLIFFSTSTLEESKNDDFRYDSRYWNPWDIEER